MIDFRVFEWFSRNSTNLKFIIPPLPPICNASREGNREVYFRGFEWFCSIWMIYLILIYFRIFVWLSSFWLIFEFLNLYEVLNNFLIYQSFLKFWIFEKLKYEFFNILKFIICQNCEYFKILNFTIFQNIEISQNLEIFNSSKYWIF